MRIKIFESDKTSTVLGIRENKACIGVLKSISSIEILTLISSTARNSPVLSSHNLSHHLDQFSEMTLKTL